MCRLCFIAFAVLLAACRPPPATLGSRVPAGELRARAVRALREVLDSGPAEARVTAITLAERYDLGALFDPVTRLLDADDERVRAAAAAATLRAHPDAPGVLRAMLHAGAPQARALAVAAVGRRVGDAARADLVAALSDPEAAVREAAVPYVDTPELVRLARADASGAVRARALSALGRRRAREGLEAARAGLADAYLGARLAAADALFAIAGREAAADLGAASDPFVELRAAVLTGDREAGLRAAVAAPDAALRAAAANEIAGEVAVARALARDAQPAVRLAAARALLRAGARADGLAALERGLGLADPWLRLAAAADLAAEGDERGARVLRELAADPELRASVLRALPRRGRVPDVVEAGLRDASPEVRVAAAAVVLERTR